jgi:cell wall-associated NlpC family hydrolase
MTRLIPYLAAGILLVLGATTARAQARYAIGGFGAVNNSLRGDLLMLGGGVTTYGRPVGVRLSGAFGTRRQDPTTTTADEATSPGMPPWMVDADLMLSTVALPELQMLLGGFDAGVFAGIGAQGHPGTGLDSGATALVSSYGGTVSRAITGALGLDLEARYRTPLSLRSSAVEPPAFPRAWEYRVGLSITFGGGRAASRGTGTTRLPGRTTSAPASASATRVLDTADDYLGTRYVYGGTSPSGGFDCSGFVQYVFRKHAVTLPRTSRQQAQVGQALARRLSALRPGDLMMFASNGSRIDHVAIYAGNNRIIHSSSSGGGVRFDDLTTSRGRWYVDHFHTARRVLDNGASLVSGLEAAFRAVATLDPPDSLAPRP